MKGSEYKSIARYHRWYESWLRFKKAQQMVDKRKKSCRIIHVDFRKYIGKLNFTTSTKKRILRVDEVSWSK
jgi:hypothetical protein